MSEVARLAGEDPFSGELTRYLGELIERVEDQEQEEDVGRRTEREEDPLLLLVLGKMTRDLGNDVETHHRLAETYQKIKNCKLKITQLKAELARALQRLADDYSWESCTHSNNVLKRLRAMEAFCADVLDD